MAELVSQNWILLVAALLLGLAVAWWVLTSSSRKRVKIEREERPAEDTPPRRNQSLIDASPAASAGASTPTVAPTPTPAEPPVTPEAAPVAEPSAPPTPATNAPAAGGDDLTRIKGLGPKLAQQLHGLGVTSFAQIAGWSDAEIERIDEQLGRFRGRIRRDDWPQQARFLATGDVAGYESQFGKL